MKKNILLFSILFLGSFIQAQHFEAGILVGGSNYLGDLSENSSRLILGETHLAGGIYGGYQFNQSLAMKLGFNYAKLSGSDANAKEENIQLRNLDFETTVYEVSLRGEWNITGFEPYNFSRPFSPFLFAGVAGFKFKPETTYEGQKIDLQSIGTEGQGMPQRDAKYKLLGFSIPVGVGVKYLLSENWTLGLEVGARYAFTDYIDDVGGTYVSFDELLAANGVLAASLSNREGELTNKPPIIQTTGSQRGDNKSNDWYFIAGLTISYNFIDNGMLGKRRRIRRSKSGCPTD